MYKTYSLSFDANRMSGVFAQFYAFVQSNAFTYQFYSPFFGCVFIKSQADLLTITSSYNSFFNGENFFCAEVEFGKTGGRLQKEVWDWMNNPVPPPIPYNPIGPD